MSRSLRVVHSIGGLHLDAGGPSRSVSQLAAGLSRTGLDVHIVAGRDPAMEVIEVDPRLTMHWIAAGHTTLAQRLRAGGFRAAIQQAIEGVPYAVVHLHGIWLRQSHDTIIAARAHGSPLILSPRGMLEPWALAYRAWKKRLAWWLYQRRDLRVVTAFHATSEQESESIRRVGLRQPVIVLPNGVELPPAVQRAPFGGRVREALFLSRIHPKKGIDLLIRAWAQVRPQGWRLTIAGNDEGGHRAMVERRIQEAGLGELVRCVGPAYGPEKERCFSRADLFVLPSYSENFGIVVAEALAYGVPVITTTGTPWAELEREGCGWWVPASADGIAGALTRAVQMPDSELKAMGLAGRGLVERCFQWDSIAGNLRKAYEALATRDVKTLRALSFVRMD